MMGQLTPIPQSLSMQRLSVVQDMPALSYMQRRKESQKVTPGYSNLYSAKQIWTIK